MQGDLKLVPAGAGSGKTFRIETELADAVMAGSVRPDRILAVTFTEAAASDLRERIRGALLKRGRIDDALAIDRAYVGTIHALGLRLLTEHSFAAGRVPSGRLLSESERDLLIRLQITRAPSLQPILIDLPRFGYKWDQQTTTSAEELFRRKVVEMIDLLRSFGTRGLSPDIGQSAIADLRALYGPTRDASRMQGTLAGAVSALVQAFPNGLAHTTSVKSARADFERDFDSLNRASIPGALARDWPLWKALGKLRCSNRTTKTPDGYDDLAQAVILAAEGLRHHPGPLEDSEAHLNALVRGAQEIMSAYDAEKRSRGLIDYADMIVETEELLRTRPEILAAVLGEIDCVVIDEFQDTNPVQFAMLWRLASRAPRALIVGDRKQAIMGFQGADPRLSAALDRAYPDKIDPLSKNFRSVPGIMELVNVIGPVLFPEGYDPLKPARQATGQTALELLEVKGKSQTYDGIASYIREIVDEAPLIEDRTTKVMRPLRPADIAILTYTRFDAARAAKSLRAAGLPVRLPESGWFASQVVQVARAALALAADPSDKFSALILLSLGPDRMDLGHTLSLAIDKALAKEVRLECLASFAEEAAGLSVSEALPRVLDLAGLPEWLATLPDRQSAEANLGRLMNEAVLFDTAETSLRASAGFHGYSIPTFLGWLADQAERELDHCPDREGWVVKGVEVSTWHASKGREWPITVVAGFDKDICARPNSIRAEFTSFDDVDTVLDGAGLSWFPSFDCSETQGEYANRRVAADEQDAARALYVALTRARDRLVLVIAPPPKAQKDPDARPKTLGALLRDRTGLACSADQIEVCGKSLPAGCRIVSSEELDANELENIVSGTWTLPGAPMEMPPASPTPWRNSPSSLPAQPDVVAPLLEHIDLAASCRGRDAFTSATDRGTAYHLAFRTLAERPVLGHRLPAATGLSEDALTRISQNVDAVRKWLASLGFTKLHFELPLQVVAPDGSQTNAIIDLLAESDGTFMVVDHKTGPCPDPSVRFASYHPQLQAYANVLAKTHPHKPVRFLAIHWMDEGSISVAAVPAEVEQLAV